MKLSEREMAFFEKARAVLEADGDHLDPEIKARRYRERLAALDFPTPAPRRKRTRAAAWAVMVIVAASVAIIAINLTVYPLRPAPVTLAEPLIADVDLLSGADPIDLYEHMAFYRWLADATENAK